MAANPENDIARHLNPQAREHYDALRALTDDGLRAHLLAAPPSGAAALTLYLLDRVVGYRKVIDDLTKGVASNGVDTSNEAAEKLSTRVAGVRATVLVEMARHREATADAIEQALGMSQQTCATRIIELRRSGYVERTGEKGLTRGGNKAYLHRLTDDGWRKIVELQQAGHEAALSLLSAEAPRVFDDD